MNLGFFSNYLSAQDGWQIKHKHSVIGEALRTVITD